MIKTEFSTKLYIKMKKLFLTVVFPLLFIISACGSGTNYFPDKFFGLELTKRLSGKEAEKVVNKLHIDKVAGERNEIGFYKSDKGKATIYVTYYDDVVKPKKEELKMTKKISPENSVFIGGEYIEIKNEEVYRCFGMGQTHYVFTHQNVLLWISVDTHWAQDFLVEYINFIN